MLKWGDVVNLLIFVGIIWLVVQGSFRNEELIQARDTIEGVRDDLEVLKDSISTIQEDLSSVLQELEITENELLILRTERDILELEEEKRAARNWDELQRLKQEIFEAEERREVLRKKAKEFEL